MCILYTSRGSVQNALKYNLFASCFYVKVTQEVWDILLYKFLRENEEEETLQLYYEAHMKGDFETKQAIHEQYEPETWAALKDHVDNFIIQLEELSAKAYGRNVNDHPRLPLIVRHNEFVKNTFLAVRSNIEGERGS